MGTKNLDAELITVQEAAELRGVSKTRIHQWLNDGRLRKEVRFGRTVVYRDEVLAVEQLKGGRPRKSTSKKGDKK